MTESREIKFESVLRAFKKGDKVKMNIVKAGNYVEFIFNGYRYATFGHFIYHEGHPVCDSNAIEAMAKGENDPETIEQTMAFNKKFDEGMDLWNELAPEFIMALCVRLVEISRGIPPHKWSEKKRKLFMKIFNDHIDPMPNDRTLEVLRGIKKKYDNKNKNQEGLG